MDDVRALLEPDETIQQYLSRIISEKVETGVQILDRYDPIRVTDVIEISGGAGAGKTEILYSVAASYLLPRNWKNVCFGGKGCHVIYFDLDYKFDIIRVSEILQNRVGNILLKSRYQGSALQLETEAIVKQSFEFLHVYKCKNTFQLLATLKIIPSTLIPRVYNSGGALGCIILDNVTAYWDLAKEIKSQLNDERKCSGMLEALVTGIVELHNLCQVPIFLSRRVSRRDIEQQRPVRASWDEIITKMIYIEPSQRISDDITAPASKIRNVHWIKPESNQAKGETFRIQNAGIMS